MVCGQKRFKKRRFAYHDHFSRSLAGRSTVELTLTQLRMFVAVAEAGSLCVRANLILGECRKTQDELHQLRGVLTGEVSLGLAAEATMRLFPALLESYRERYPPIAVHLTSATSRVLTAWVRDGSLDFALALIAPEADIHDMETSRLFDSDVAVIARRGHPLVRSRKLASLAAAQWVSTRQLGGGARSNRLSALFEDAKRAAPRIAATTEAVFDTLHCVAASDYLAFEPAGVAAHPFFRDHVTVVPVAERGPYVWCDAPASRSHPPPPNWRRWPYRSHGCCRTGQPLSTTRNAIRPRPALLRGGGTVGGRAAAGGGMTLP
ncbi:Transcriptional regulator, LysR family [Candidatus Burkholderia brachyanthoides]|nr:Transcriptional regulator, LysR family [Candidatus Burkholderia brachyanthoides]